jgi:hypothetical protein
VAAASAWHRVREVRTLPRGLLAVLLARSSLAGWRQCVVWLWAAWRL